MEALPSAAIRLAGADDTPVIQELAARIWRQHYPGIITHEQIDYMLQRMYSAEFMRNEMERQGYTYLPVLTDGGPVGFSTYIFERERAVVTLSKLYLLPSLHGKGIGRTLLQRVKNMLSAAEQRGSPFS